MQCKGRETYQKPFEMRDGMEDQSHLLHGTREKDRNGTRPVLPGLVGRIVGNDVVRSQDLLHHADKDVIGLAPLQAQERPEDVRLDLLQKLRVADLAQQLRSHRLGDMLQDRSEVRRGSERSPGHDRFRARLMLYL